MWHGRRCDCVDRALDPIMPLPACVQGALEMWHQFMEINQLREVMVQYWLSFVQPDSCWHLDNFCLLFYFWTLLAGFPACCTSCLLGKSNYHLSTVWKQCLYAVPQCQCLSVSRDYNFLCWVCFIKWRYGLHLWICWDCTVCRLHLLPKCQQLWRATQNIEKE